MNTNNCVGKWVINKGLASRHGWLGQVVLCNEEYVRIRWVYDQSGSRIDTSRHSDLSVEGIRQYTLEWFSRNGVEFDAGAPPSPEHQPSDTYIVWSPQGSRNPSVTHRTKDEAIKAAKEMATRYRGQTFNVCKVVGKASEVPNVVYEEL